MIEIKITIEELPGPNMDIKAFVPNRNGSAYELDALDSLIEAINERLKELARENGSEIEHQFTPLPKIYPCQNPGRN